MDPFDRMPITQALVESLSVSGSHDRFEDYGVKRLT
jgi:PIN domain nuclease of toxin-antitoxin system